MVNGKDISADERIAKHEEWAKAIMSANEITADSCEDILKAEIGKVFTAILEQCGVYERSEKGKNQFIKFVESV